MKILHTADIHLRTVGDARWSAVECLLQLAEESCVSLLVISGDLFDRQIDAQKLKIPLRDLIGTRKYPVVILPGNHDVTALSDGDYYGENTRILSSADAHIDIGDVRLLGLPFQKIAGEKVLERLLAFRDNLRPNATNILLYHGELLDLLYSRDSFGDEETGYMPARLSFFDGLGIDYVVAGHFHSSFEVQRYDGGYFVYPGSPVSITKKETGSRSVNLFEVGEPPRRQSVDTEHYVDVSVTLNPFAGQDPRQEIEQATSSCHPMARILLTITGFVDLAALGLTEAEFADAVIARSSPQVESVSSQWKDIGVVREHDLFARFMTELDDTSLPIERRFAIRELALESMMEVLRAD